MAKSLLNQLRYRFSSPQIERQSQLFWVPVLYRPGNLGGLPGEKCSPFGTALPLPLQRFLTSVAKLLYPCTNSLASHTQYLRHLELLLTIQNGLDRLLPKVFLRNSRKGTGIFY